MTSMQMYWITRLDGIDFVVTTAAVMGFIASAVATVFWIGIRYDDCSVLPMHKKLTVCAWVIVLLSILTAVFVPTTKEMAAIIIVPKIVNNEQVQGFPDKLLKLGNEWITNKTKDIQGDSK